MHPALRLAVVVLVLASSACTAHRSTERRPRTGEISFRLTWEGDADLDLHVLEPGGAHTGFTQVVFDCATEPATPRGQAMFPASAQGILDIDCNASPEEICSRPVENTFWPLGSAPAGRYEVWVQLFRVLSEPAPVPFLLEIREGEVIRHVVRGTLEVPFGCSERLPWDYTRPVPAMAVAALAPEPHFD